MLKLILRAFIITSLCSCENHSVEKSQQNVPKNDPDTLQIKSVLDSVEMEDSFAEWPFTDSIIGINYFLTKLDKKAILKKVLEKNIYDPNVIDTIRTLHWDSSYVETISNSYTKQQYINTTTLDDTTFTLKKSIKVGMPEETVFKIFHASYDKNKTYRYLSLYAGDGAVNYVTIYFRNRKIKFIVYSPYTG